MEINRKVTDAIYHIFVLVFGIIMIYPVIWMICSSVKDNAAILGNSLQLITDTVHWENYSQGWSGFGGITFATFFKNSAIVSIVSTTGTVLSSTLVAYALARVNFKGRKFWFTAMILTMMLPGQVIMIPQYIIYNKLGLVGTYIPLWITKFCGVPFFIYMIMQFIQGLPRELDEAAEIDGCSKYTIFSHIIFPLLGPSLITTIVIQFYWTWDDFMGPLIYLSRPATYTVSLAIKMFADSTAATSFGPMFAMSTLSLIPVFLVFLIFNRYLMEGVTAGSIKG